MERYSNLHRWMFLPMVIMQLGIFTDYWGDFTLNAWSIHIHYWTGTLWYLYLIIQPYLATHGQMARHRTNGIVGMFLAGGVCFTALSMMSRDIGIARLAAEMPERFGPFEPWFFYGVISIEMPMILLFGNAVIQAILRRKNLADHAWWLVSSVFVIMFPALARGLQGLAIAMDPDAMPDVDIMTPTYVAVGIIVALTLWAAKRYGRLRHPATYLAVGVNLYILLMEPLGRSEWLQDFFKGLIVDTLINPA